MIKNYFTNLENIVKSELKKAQNSIKVAVAWINFNIYEDVFKELLSRGVHVHIIINNDIINMRYIDNINYLNETGANIQLVSFAGTMHHKFCIIDSQLCIFGSFNWTINANSKNIEDINICDEYNVINNYLLEFDALSSLSKSDIKMLQNPKYCPNCGEPIVNILFFDVEDDYQTRIDVIEICNCNQKTLYTDYFDYSLYANYYACIEKYEEQLEEAHMNNDDITYNKIKDQQDFECANYWSNVRNNRMTLPIIHAVGVNAQHYLYGDDVENYYKIIWKERGTYYISAEYYF